MQNLNISLCIDAEGNLITKQAHPSNNILHELGIKDFSNLVGVEFLLDVDDELMSDTIVIKLDLYKEMFMGEETVIKFSKDGTFTYYKFFVPTLAYFHKGWISEDPNIPNKKVAVYKIPMDSPFFYKGLFRVATSDIEVKESEINNTNTKIVKVDELWEYQPSNMLSFQKIIFSFCNLQKCLLNLQKVILMDPNNCNGCGRTSENTLTIYNRDFLLIAVHVLEYLTSLKKYEEAQNILDSLSDCSGAICKNLELKSNCNCGKVI